MGTVKLKRYQRRKNIGDSSSPLYYYLRQKPDSGQLYNINRIASEIEGIGALSVEDVEHVIKSLVRSMKQILRDGNRVKLDNFGTFYITFRCPGVETAAKCSVKNIRFLADNTLKLVNESTVTTKGALNNVVFELEKLESGSGSGGSDSGGDGGLDENPLG
ncbi:MAG TPA: DNA-binding protein [Bacteroides cellulosilyticus]|nr:DNA-binding protein [Bacteroides cellulosilyticus]